MRKSSSAWLAGVAAVVVAGTAVAAPLDLRGGVDATRGNAVVKVHEGCHYDCRFSRRLGWHNHSNAECRPEACRDRGRRPDYESGERFYRGGHPCHYDCRFSPEFGWHNHSNAACRPEPCRGR